MTGVVERQWLLAQLVTLSERQAQVLAYRFLDGMTQGEIAEVMGLSRKTIVRVCAELDARFTAGPSAAALTQRCG